MGGGADLALGFATLGAGFFAAARLALTLALTFLALAFLALTFLVFTFRRAGAAFALRLTAFFFLLAFAFRFFAMSLSQSLVK
jgi:hypothetical protein